MLSLVTAVYKANSSSSYFTGREVVGENNYVEPTMLSNLTLPLPCYEQLYVQGNVFFLCKQTNKTFERIGSVIMLKSVDDTIGTQSPTQFQIPRK